MLDPIDTIDMKSCRICLTNNKPLCPLFRYKLSGNYAEMLTAIADVKVSSNDGLPEKICLKCCTTLEKAYLLKTVAERSDKKLRKILAREKGNVPTKKIAFDSFTDIKSEIGPLTIKPEPKWEMEIEVPESSRPVDTMEVKDIVIANTVIRKVDPNAEEIKLDSNDDVQLTWTSSGNSHYAAKGDPDAEYLEDDVFQDDDDDDYIPPVEKPKTKFKKPKLSDIKVFKDPILKNGSRGSPILLKRPKDATILKVHPGYKSKSQSSSSESVKVVRRDKPVRMVRTSVSKQREKLVCPVCGILTFTLGNHMATHQEKKRYTCAQCPRSFAQKSNLLIHAKQHTGIKDHICEVCGAGFYSQKSLVRHNLIHKGERPFSCNLCTKRFIARCDLNRHLRIHSGYKPYKCNTCTMSFNAKHQLQNHERMHTGERPYTCQVCNVAFSYKVNLNNHVYKVHGINLKFKSIHTVTEDILRREMGMMNETRVAITHILPQLGEVPTPAAHETVLSLT
ncbi:histone-lysine N-methyltransferase PRDM9 isoform X3 [Spodoptera frugiperda]|uniref:Histone-lysine N-methyltransferase PRDM9 isoform X3 n=1 Tax=Spodoptera frugiperda TaxID=7108 RepID=A0A9R0DK56_SPOFR|nr:histone-lysine N-methyltransferase PRDM9 isoform X3 [Spodoptera frugiperda]